MTQRGPSGAPFSDGFLTDEDVKALTDERTTLGLSYEQQAERILREGASEAALEIVNLARFSAKENIRLAAAKYLLDRVLPKDLGPESDDPLTKFLSSVSREA